MTSNKMRAVTLERFGSPSVLAVSEVERPALGQGDILVHVRASGVNRADLLQRRGLYAPPLGVVADIPGLEYAGTIEALGAGVEDRKPGDRVMGIVAGGGYAEYVSVPSQTAVRVPPGLALEQAGAIPEVFMTAYDALVLQLGLKKGDTVLVHAVGSGVGTAAIQLAAAAGARVLGTSRTRSKLDHARKLGLQDAFPSTGSWPDEVLAATGGRGVDLVLDLVGSGYLAGNLRVLASGGRQIVVGLSAGRTAEIDLGLLLTKRLTLIGTTLRGRPVEEKAALARAFETQVVPMFERGELEPVVDVLMPAQEVVAAHERLERNANFGKIVLVWD